MIAVYVFWLVGVLICLFFLPIGRKSSIRITRSSEQVDERDTIFARFDLIPGTEMYDAYYTAHPGFKDIDDRIRALPRLLSVGGRYFDPVRSRLVEALFELESKHVELVDGAIERDGAAKLSAKEASYLIKKAGRQLGADDVGIASLDRRHLYSHVGRGPEPWGAKISTSHTFVVAFTVQMRHKPVSEAPTIGITEESAIQYLNAQRISIGLAGFIRNLGYSARAHISGSNYQLILPAVAHAAGLGEIGRLGYLISPKHGARIRLGAVSTELSLQVDAPIQMGVQEFCSRCKKCAVCCPSGAIPGGSKSIAKGVEKWRLDADRCYRYWRVIGTDCGLCMKVCPFSHPNTLIHNVIRKGIKRSAVARRAFLAGDSIFFGKMKKWEQ